MRCLEQKKLLNQILLHWEDEKAQSYHPDRQEALSLIRVIDNIQIMKEEIQKKEGVKQEDHI